MIALAALALLSAACSSTTKAASTSKALDVRRPTTATGGEGGETATEAAPGTTVVGPSGRTTGGTAARQALGTKRTMPGAGATSGEAAGGATGPPLLIGYYGTEATSGTSFGVNGQVLGDPTVIGNAVANWVNSHGGMAGRQIKLAIATTPLTPTTPQDQIDQAACAKFTEDNHVFAVASITLATAAFYQCVQAHHVLAITPSVTGPDQAWFMKYASTAFSTFPTQDRVGAATADGLWRVGYLSDPGAKIGVVTSDYPWFQSGVTAFEREAAKHHVPVTATATVCHTPCSSSEQSQDAQNDVVKFRGAGINHVVILSMEAATFIQAASAGGYTPRYGFNSYALPFIWPLEHSSAFAGGAIGAGFVPSEDVNRAQNPPFNARTQLCEQIMRDAGVNENNFSVEIQTYTTCDEFFFLKDVLDRAGKADYGAMGAVVEGLGSTLVPVSGFSTSFGPLRHDGLQTYRIVEYSAGCNCMQYRGSTEYPIPALPGQAR